MQVDINDFEEHQRRIVQRYFRLMGALEKEYKKSKPQYGEQGFKERVYGKIKNLLIEDAASVFLPTGQVNAAKFVELISHEGPDIESDVSWVYLSCANSVAAMWAMDEKDQERAWDLLCEAHFYFGAVMVTNRGEEIFTEAIVGTYKSAIAAERGAKRHDKTNALKARAHEIMRSQAPWISQARATAIIEADLKKELGEIYNLRDPVNTIKGWIQEMPDRLDLIPSLRERLKQA